MSSNVLALSRTKPQVILRRQGFFDALLLVFCLMLLTSNQFVFNRRLSRKPKNIKPKTSLIDTYSGYIYLKLG